MGLALGCPISMYLTMSFNLTLPLRYARSDSMVRTQALTLLAKLPGQVKGQVYTLAQHLIGQLVTKYKDLVKAVGFRNFPNSLSHREKHRAFCAFFMLEKFIDKVLQHCIETF